MSLLREFDFDFCKQLFDDISSDHHDFIVTAIRATGGLDDFENSIELSTECLFAAAAHYCHENRTLNQRERWYDALAFADTELHRYDDVRRRYRLFVHLYDPCALDTKTGITMRDFLQCKHFTAGDVVLLTRVGLLNRPSSATLTRVPLSRALYSDIRQSVRALDNSVIGSSVMNSSKVSCLTEWRTFDENVNRDRSCLPLRKAQRYDSDGSLTVTTAVDICVRRFGETLQQTLDNYLFKFAQFQIDGSLNSFLFRLHGASLRKRLCRRASQLFVTLQQHLHCRHIVECIVSIVLCAEHRYAAATLCDGAPVAFRQMLQTFHVPVHVPLMVPCKMTSIARFSVHGKVNGAEVGQIDKYPIVHKRSIAMEKSATSNADLEQAILYFDLFPIMLEDRLDDEALDGCVGVSGVPNFSFCGACLLFSLPTHLSFDSVIAAPLVVFGTPCR